MCVERKEDKENMNKFLKGFVCALLVLSTGCAKEEKKETVAGMPLF